MDPRLFDKTPDIAPILVRLYDSQRLQGLARDETPLARAELTSAVVELLEKEIGPRERELVSDVLISLMRQAEQDLRQAIAERLSVLDSTPLRVVLHIANDDIAVAAPILKSSPVLSDLDLLYIIKGKTPEYWQAVAARARLSEGVINVLAETREIGTACVLAENENIRLTGRAFDIMGEMAVGNDRLARPLLMRPDVPEVLARKLYAVVGGELKNYIRDYYGLHGQAGLDAVEDIVLEFSGSRDKFMPSQNAIDAAEMYARAGRLDMITMMDSLQRGQISTFIAMFARYSGIEPRKIHDSLSDGRGRVLAAICRALEISKSDLSRIYMMTQRIRSEDRIVDQKDMMRCLSVFERLSVEDAQNLTGISGRRV